MSLKLIREPDLAAEWDLPVSQFRLLRRRHNWAHVRLTRQDIRYTDAQIEHIVHQMTVLGKPKKKAADDAGLTGRSAARAS